jgi:hypothetical protein
MLSRYLLTTVAATALLIGQARADSTVAAMTAAGALAGPELFYCVQTAADHNCTATQLKTFVTSSGVVTSVGFSVPATSIFTATGSPVTGSGTLGFTTAGTSGGIPYFSSAAALSSSAVLTANLPVIGGGAGVAPTVGSVSGNTTKFATVNTTTFTTGQCVQVDASLNLTTTGSACGAGGGGTPGGSTTQVQYNNSGAFGGAAGVTYTGNAGQLNFALGSIAANVSAVNITGTFNNNAVTFDAPLFMNITNTASAAASLLMDLQVGGNTSVSATTDGWIALPNNLANNVHFGIGNKGGNLTLSNTVITLQLIGNEVFIGASPPILSFLDQAFLISEASNVLAQRNSTAAQTFRVYNTFTDASNYERGVMDWTTTGNTLIIGQQLLGTGQARQVSIAAPLHLGYTSGTPTANSCAGFALTTGSSDVAGKVTFTSATACSITFANAFTNAPFCVVSPGSAASTHDAVTSTTGLAVTFGTANTSMQWHCFGS